MQISSLHELPLAAEAIIGHLKTHPVVAFHGPMGAGKTTLIAEILRRLGSSDEVSSPTFALVNEYLTAANDPVYHFDFYRIDTPAEALDMGVMEYLDSGSVCLLEWPERIIDLLPPDTLHVNITPLDETAREMSFRTE